MLRDLGILTPAAINNETIFILAGPHQQADNPFTGTRVFQRRGIRVPAIEITGDLHFIEAINY